MVTDKELQYWIAFSRIPGIGRVRIGHLRQRFSTLETAWKAPPSELGQAGLDLKLVETVAQWRRDIAPGGELDKLRRHNVQAYVCDDESYPSRLKEIYDYPPVLYVRGRYWNPGDCALSIVGTRRVTVYGRQVTEELCRDLVASGVTIVSGLARGVDTIAHRTAVEAGGKTIAVFGCGLDIVYPAENARLAQSIIENGSLVSEYPVGTKPKADNFPRRNRIMSGISLGVVVIEAGEKSGALITAQQALEQNREVFAVPGSILSAASRGCNHLIQRGEAKLVLTAGDILEELNLSVTARQLQINEMSAADDIELSVLKHLGGQPLHVDEICRVSGLAAAVVNSTLTVLELKGVVRQFGNLNFALARNTNEVVGTNERG